MGTGSFAASSGYVINSEGQAVNTADSMIGNQMSVRTGQLTDVSIPQVRHGEPGGAATNTAVGQTYTALPVKTSRSKRTRVLVSVTNTVATGGSVTAGTLNLILSSGGPSIRRAVPGTTTKITSGGNDISTTVFDVTLEPGYAQVGYEFIEGNTVGKLYGVVTTTESVVL